MAHEYFKKENYQRKPEWLKVQLPQGKDYKEIRDNMRTKGLATVCEEARCPNLSECWSARTATVMILGDTCTRACKFCNVKTGNPKGFINQDEIINTSKMVSMMNLRYIVITSVDRDDLPDHGAGHFASVIKQVHADHPETKVEVLIPDFGGVEERMRVLADANPFVIAQNVETVKRLTHPVRDPRASYERTLSCLKFYKENYPHIQTKTSLMVGLGETWQEIQEALEDIRAHKVDIITFGQYLQPSKRHLNVEKYYSPEEFEELKRMSLKLGFKFVASGPLVRSSYKAGDFLDYVESVEKK
ncbi:MAG TPA: lipoyl synthase [Bacteriovoracaceae bacterium]|nr:lipoyl synthase [Bacteriovoracaceae bacterium]